MSDWVSKWNSEWILEWLGMCPANTFDFEFPIVFNWFTNCGDGGPPFTGYGDAGAMTLVLDLENGFSVKHSWITDVIKARSGVEQRISRNDTDRESYAGVAFLTGENPRAIRGALARYAAIGSTFLLGIPHEEIALRADSFGTTVYVPAGALALVDWATTGQRVVVAHVDDEGEIRAVSAVVQSADADSIELDIQPGAAGAYGGTIMPAKAAYLEPQQNFPRYQVNAEQWQLQARCAMPIDFAPVLASLSLDDITVSAAFDSAVVTAREFGLIGNTRLFYLFSDVGAPAAGTLLEDLDTGEFGFTYKPGVSTMGDLATALDASVLGKLTGSWVAADTIASGDQFAPVALTGAGDTGAVGTGATLEEYESRKVWSRALNIEGTITDGIHAMTQILDHGGVPYALGTADKADWFRAVSISGGDQYDWQWFKLFMSTVVGRQKKFWLPTWRDDLLYFSHAGTALTIDVDAGDFTAWWPAQRQHIQVAQGDTVTYAEVLAAVDNDDGTRTLTLSVSLDVSAVTMVSWLELCRFENADEYTTVHNQHGFDVTLTARVVP